MSLSICLLWNIKYILRCLFFFLLHTTEVNGQQFSECHLLCSAEESKSFKVSLFCETVCHVDLAHYLSWSFWLWRAIHWGQSAETFWLWVFNISHLVCPLLFLLISDTTPSSVKYIRNCYSIFFAERNWWTPKISQKSNTRYV